MSRITHTIILIFSAIALSGFINSCKDKPPVSEGECTTCQYVNEAKDFFAFKYGSWWVYEEETSHERDSMYVTLYNNDANSYQFECHIKSSLAAYNYRYWPEYYNANNTCSTIKPVHKKCLYVILGKGKFQDNLGDSEVFFVQYKNGDFIYASPNFLSCPNNKLTVGSIDDEYVLLYQSYGKTIRMDELCNYAEGKQPTKIYYSKGVGVVRKELIDSNEVWNLVNYHIQE